MNIWPSVVVSLLLLAAAVGLMLSHLRTWRRVRQGGRQADEEIARHSEEFDYRRRQFRRRMQTSGMLAVLAVAVLAGELLTAWIDSRWFELAFWGSVLLLLAWICLLALLDAVATSLHFGRLRQSHLNEQARLQAQLRQAQAARGNGKAVDGDGKARKNSY